MSDIPLIYRSTDADAPQLTGQAGSLVTVLDAVLVDGYGVGVDAKRPAGWTREFTAANKRVYRNSLIRGTGTYLRIDDTGSEQLADPRCAWLRAFETMANVDVGTNPCPTDVQLGRGIQVMKSASANASLIDWVIVACDRYAYLFISPLTTNVIGWAGVARCPYFFGDFDSNAPGDDFNFMVTGIATQTFSTNATGIGGMYSTVSLGSNISSNSVCYVLRPYDSVIGAVVISLTAPRSYGSTTSGTLGGGGPTPNPVTGGLLFEPAFLHEGAMLPRGTFPGLLAPLNHVPFDDLVVAPTLAGYEGVRFVAKRIFASSGSFGVSTNFVGQVLLEAYEHE